MQTPPQLSLLVQIPGPAGSGLLLEDLLTGRQRHFDSPEPLLGAIAESVHTVVPTGKAAPTCTQASNPSPDKEPT